MAKYGFKSEAEKEQERLIREQQKEASGRAELERTAGSKIVPAEMRQAVEEKNTRASIKKQALESGMSEDEANRAVAESGIGSVTPRLDRMAGEQRRLEESRAANPDPNLQGFKTYGDKARFETQNAIRKLQGRPQLTPDTPEQFRQDIGTSMGFGEKSALLTPEGQARAIGKGVKSGLSPEAANAAVQRAFKTLKGTTEGKAAAGVAGGTAAVVPPMLARPQEVAPTARGATPSAAPIQVEPTQVEKGPVESFLGIAAPAVSATGLYAPMAKLPSIAAGRATQRAATVAGEVAKLGPASKYLAEGAAAKQELTAAQKALASTSRLGGGKAPIAGSPYEKALAKWTEKSIEATGKVKAAEEGGQAVSKATSALAKAEAGAARAAKLAEFVKPVAGVSKAVGKIATPVAVGMELYDTAKFAFSPEEREKMTREVEATAEKGALRSAAGGALSPMKTILSTGKLVGEALQSGRRARESAAAASTAERRSQVMAEERRKDFTDEEFKALSQEERSGYLKQLRERVKVK